MGTENRFRMGSKAFFCCQLFNSANHMIGHWDFLDIVSIQALPSLQIQDFVTTLDSIQSPEKDCIGSSFSRRVGRFSPGIRLNEASKTDQTVSVIIYRCPRMIALGLNCADRPPAGGKEFNHFTASEAPRIIISFGHILNGHKLYIDLYRPLIVRSGLSMSGWCS
jgi:hypothetical protein